MRSGQLRHRLVIQVSVGSTGDGMGGGGIASWEDEKEVQGQVSPLTGTEKMVAMQKGSEENCKIYMRYTSGITPRKRFRLADTTTFYDIVSVVNPDLRNRELILYCRQEL